MFRGALVVLCVGLVLWRIPSPIDPEQFEYPTALQPLPNPEDALSINFQKINGMYGAESFAIDSDHRVYTGLGDGRIVRSKLLDSNSNSKSLEFEDFARTGEELEECGEAEFEWRCGRPLGLKFDLNGDLIVADAYKGLLRISRDGTSKSVLAKEGVFLANALEIDLDSGKIYFTDSTDKFQRNQITFEVVESRPRGKLLMYNPANQSLEVLASNLYFPNGIAFTKDKSALLITSTSRSLLQKFDLKKRKMETINDNLPGIPDNIIPWRNHDTYLIGCSNHRAAPFSLLHYISSYPSLKKLIAKVIPYEWIIRLQPLFGLVLEVNENGKVVRSLTYAKNTRIGFISEAFEYNGKLLLGSFRNQLLGICDVPQSLIT